jgi:hypothetical protein
MGRNRKALRTTFITEPGDIRCVVLPGAGERCSARGRPQGAQLHDRCAMGGAAQDVGGPERVELKLKPADFATCLIHDARR